MRIRNHSLELVRISFDVSTIDLDTGSRSHIDAKIRSALCTNNWCVELNDDIHYVDSIFHEKTLDGECHRIWELIEDEVVSGVKKSIREAIMVDLGLDDESLRLETAILGTSVTAHTPGSFFGGEE